MSMSTILSRSAVDGWRRRRTVAVDEVTSNDGEDDKVECDRRRGVRDKSLRLQSLHVAPINRTAGQVCLCGVVRWCPVMVVVIERGFVLVRPSRRGCRYSDRFVRFGAANEERVGRRKEEGDGTSTSTKRSGECHSQARKSQSGVRTGGREESEMVVVVVSVWDVVVVDRSLVTWAVAVSKSRWP